VSPEAETIYKLYPNQTTRGREGKIVSTQKQLKHKEKIQKLLLEGYPMLTVMKQYIPSTSHHKNLDTFLNNLPDPDSIPKPQKAGTRRPGI